MRQLNLENFRKEDKTETRQVTIFRGILGCFARDRLEEAMKLKHICSLVHFLPSVHEQHLGNT